MAGDLRSKLKRSIWGCFKEETKIENPFRDTFDQAEELRNRKGIAEEEEPSGSLPQSIADAVQFRRTARQAGDPAK